VEGRALGLASSCCCVAISGEVLNLLARKVGRLHCRAAGVCVGRRNVDRIVEDRKGWIARKM
jgi:hypothetical protein